LKLQQQPLLHHRCKVNSTRLQGDSITSSRQDKDQTHIGVVDRAAVHEQERYHQASDIVDIIGVLAERLEDVPYLTAGRTKEPRETNCRRVFSAEQPGHKYAPFIRYALQKQDFSSIRGQTFPSCRSYLKTDVINRNSHSLQQMAHR